MQAKKAQDTRNQQQKFIECQICSFGYNKLEERVCRICLEPLTLPKPPDKASNFEDKLKSKNIGAKEDKTKKKRVGKKSKNSELGQLEKLKKLVNKSAKSLLKTISSNKILKELTQPSTLIGLGILGLAGSLWLSTFWSPENKSDAAKNIEQNNQEQIIETFPNGVFNYGGSPLFAPLVSNGLNTAIEAKNPGTTLRFSQPLNDEHSSKNGVKRLLREELSFSFTSRGLTDAEYISAELRRVKLEQAPVATDGIVFFGNNNGSVKGLNMSQVRDIYQGKIKNWAEINSQAPDLPIVIVFSNEEEVEAFGIDPSSIPDSAKYVSSYTRSIREVIRSPGAISFASASLLKEQQLVQFLDLAEGDSKNYVSPFVAGDPSKPNLEAFKNEKYPATRTVFVGYRDDDTLDCRTGVSYVNFLNSSSGQEIIKASGFVPWGRSR